MAYTYRFMWSEEKRITEIKSDVALPQIAIGNRMTIVADTEETNDVAIKDILVAISHLGGKLVQYDINVTVEKVNLISEGHTV